ncbi:MAG: monofunctional biosynthetic peptidoglycan transglycosylase [Spirosomataceae bacterium]
MRFIPKPTTENPSIWTRIKYWLLKITIYFFIISISLVIIYKWVPIPVTSTMIARKMEAIADGKDSEIHYDWVSYDEMSKEAGLAVVAAEDQLFPTHWGFDFEAMGNAFSRNLKGKKIRGASTISQQVAKNVFLWQSRNYVRKALEVYFTFLIELIWGKERILEVYLNVAEMGNMTFGVEEASKRYYGKSAKNLARTEAARIAAVLPSPRKWSIAKPGPYVNRRTLQITRQMRALGGVKYIGDL